MRKVEMINALKKAGYRSDPVKAWKASIATTPDEEEPKSQDEENPVETEANDYNYLLSMSLWSLTREKKEELLKNRDDKVWNLCYYLNSVWKLCGNQMIVSV